MKKATILLLTLVLTTSLAAQQTTKLDWLLALQEKLSLNETQVHRIQEVKAGLQKKCIKLEAGFKLAEVELEQLKQDPAKNLKAIEKKYHDIASLKADREFAPVKAGVEAEAILTPEQREQYKKMKSPLSLFGHVKDTPAKENVFYHAKGDTDGSVWIEKNDATDNPEAVYEFKTQDGKGAVWHVKKKVREDRDDNVIFDDGETPASGKENTYDVSITADTDSVVTVKILKKSGTKEDEKRKTIILKDEDIDEITTAEDENGENKIIKIKVKDGEKRRALAKIREIEDEDIEKILDEHPGKSIMIIKHADGKTEVIKDLKAIEEKEKELKADSGEKKEGLKVLLKKVKEEEK